MRRSVPVPTADTVSWSLICGLVLTLLAMNQIMGFGVLPARAVLPGIGLAALAGMLLIGRARGNVRLIAGATAFLQMTLFTILGVVLTFLLAAHAGPLWDARLAAADVQLGLGWPAIFAAADQMPRGLLLLAGAAYHSLVIQMVGCVVLLAITGRLQRLRVMVAAAILSGTVTVLVSGLVPAVGNLFDPDRYQALWPSVAWLDRDLIWQLRDGTIRQIDLSHMTGIVSFPSYHAALPLILAWAVSPVSRLRLPAALWAALTITATPLFGGHYFVDVLAGLLLAVVALAVARRLPAGEPEVERVPRFGGCDTTAIYAADLHLHSSKRRAGVINDVV